ncbi:MAG: hypothetical protein OXK21_00650 [Chloroflexota bacterium]|nr:hypothetical protein [Chloroflexota bacterium]
MTYQRSKTRDGRTSRDGGGKPDLKWVVEYLVRREGQRKTAALLGVNRKTVALALSRERLTSRMALAVQRFMASLDDLERERGTPLDRLEARMRQALKGVDDMRRVIEALTERVEVLEAAQTPGTDAEGRGLGLFDRWRKRKPQRKDERDG